MKRFYSCQKIDVVSVRGMEDCPFCSKQLARLFQGIYCSSCGYQIEVDHPSLVIVLISRGQFRQARYFIGSNRIILWHHTSAFYDKTIELKSNKNDLAHLFNKMKYILDKANL